MATTKVSTTGRLASPLVRWRVRLGGGMIVIAVVGVVLVALTSWAHWSGITVEFRGERFECGSLAAPIERGVTVVDRCSGAILTRHLIRAAALIALVLFVMLPLLVITSRRWTAQRSFRQSDGPTAIRWYSGGDVDHLRSSLDDDVLTAFSWTAEDRDAFVGSLVPGWGSGLLVITETGVDRPIGAVRAVPVAAQPLVMKIVFWIAPSRRGLGHAKRGVSLVAEHLAERRAVLIADAEPHHEAARAVLEAAGLRHTGDFDGRAQFTRHLDDVAAPADESATERQDRARRVSTWLLRVSGAAVLLFVALLVWSVYEALTEHTASVFVSVPAGEIDCGSLSSRVDHAVDSYNRRCDAALRENAADRFRGIATGVLAALGLMFAFLTRRAARSGAPAADHPLTAEAIRDLMVGAERPSDGAVQVRAVLPSDAQAVLDTIDDEVVDAMGWSAAIREGYGSSIAHDLASGLFVICEGDTDGVVGVISLVPEPPRPTAAGAPTVRVGTWMGSEHRRLGYMTEALTLVSSTLIEHGVGLMAETSVENQGARRAFARAGFVERGTTAVDLPNGTKLVAVTVERSAEMQA